MSVECRKLAQNGDEKELALFIITKAELQGKRR